MTSLAEIIAAKKLKQQQEIEKKLLEEGEEAISIHQDTAYHNAAERSEAQAALPPFPTSPSISIPKKKTLAEILASKGNSVALPPIEASNFTKKTDSELELLSSEERQAYYVAEQQAARVKTQTENTLLPIPSVPKPEETAEIIKDTGTFSLDISLNEKQNLAKDMAFNGKSFCLIGAAGTGKTTTQREIAKSLLQQNKLSTHNFRIQGTGGERWSGPSIAFVAYTRIASGNLKRAIHKDPELEDIFQHNITTIHNLLEYEPEFYYDYETQKEKMRFIPRRNASNPLDVTHIIIEEASMVGLDLWEKLYAAMRPKTQIIILGDINQLPPVFGSSVLNYALVQLPVVELTHVYRQKGDSSILENAHRILRGEYPLLEAPDFTIMRNGTVQHSQAKLSEMIGKTFPRFAQLERDNKGKGYDPTQDIILSPFNKQDLGTDNLNKWIAQFLGTERNAVVYHVSAGITQHFLAVGDKIMYNKQVGEIVDIKVNYEYTGKEPMQPATTLTRFGTYTGSAATDNDDGDFVLAGYSNLDLDKMLEENQKEDLVRSASHHVKLLMETGLEIDLCNVGDFAPSIFTLGYALTVHKAQGCEWRKVFIVLHKDHSIMAFRELLYTAVTRAKEQCILITKDFMIEKAIKTQRIKGNNLQEKIEYFNSGVLNQNDVYITKEF